MGPYVQHLVEEWEARAIESDARADLEPELLAESDESHHHPICVSMVDGTYPDDEYYVGVREARVLAARLLRAADAAEAAGARST